MRRPLPLQDPDPAPHPSWGWLGAFLACTAIAVPALLEALLS